MGPKSSSLKRARGGGADSLAVQWLGLRAFTAEGTGSIPGQGTKIPQALRHGQNQKQTNKNRLGGRGLHFSHPSTEPS